MSKGLGKLQWRILAYMQYDRCGTDEIQRHGRIVDLQEYPDLYDLRHIQERMSHIHEKRERYLWMDRRFEASFSRAIHSLIKRGILEGKGYPAGRPFRRQWGEWSRWQTAEERKPVIINSRQKTRLVKIKLLPPIPQWAFDELTKLVAREKIAREERLNVWMAQNNVKC